MTTVIFLHGLLGAKQDWQSIQEKLARLSPTTRTIALDLPYHNANQAICVKDFAEVSQWLSQQIVRLVADKPYILVGYSLGGRIAAYFATQTDFPIYQLNKVILEGANLGLTSPQEKQARWHNDTYWSKRFITEEITEVLRDWYQQPVFADLPTQIREILITQRSENSGNAIGKMLLATSLAVQPALHHKLASTHIKFYYLYGENDIKFATLAQQYQLPTSKIKQAGHNAHWQNPTEFASVLYEIINNGE